MIEAFQVKIRGIYLSVVRPLLSMRRLNLVLFIVAVVFLYGMVRQVGVESLQHYFRQVGWYGLLLVIPYGIMNLLTAMAWKQLLVGDWEGCSLWRLFLLRLAGEALNQLTPTASLGGEPFKAVRLQASGVPWQAATATLVIHKGLMVMSLVLYIATTLALVPFVLPVRGAQLAVLVLCAGLLALGGITFVILQRKHPCAMLIKMLEKWGLCPAVLKARQDELAHLDDIMAGFYGQFPGRGTAAFVFLFLNWLVQGAEVYLIFWLLGHSLSWPTALCLDALSMIFTGLGFMIPAQLGVQDGGNVLLTLGLKMGAAVGVAFSIMRRIREACWLLLGLLVVLWER